MDKREIIIKIGGEAGFGIKVAGLILTKTCFRAGLGVFGYSEYPSLIRGGHNSYQLNIKQKNVFSATKKIDILVALNKETVDLHKGELNNQGIIIHDGLKLNQSDFRDVNLLNIPLVELAKKAGGELTRNIVALGAIVYLLGLDLELFNQELKKEFGDKGTKIVAMNRKAAKFGYSFVGNLIKSNSRLEIKRWNLNKRQVNDYILTANESTAFGIIQAGCKLYAAYPMTPATSIMHVLAAKQRDFDLVMHQSEDEISAIGSAIGAAAVGVRTAVGTSGGGFALMVENLGLAAMTETPLVIIESQRPAPATGLPTWMEQGDLKFLINASPGDFPRIVIAPGDAEESFYMIQEAFNLADKFQLSVIFLLDKLLSESDYVLENLDIHKIKIKREGLLSDNELGRIKDYKRYEYTQNGISKRALPGQMGGVHIINSDEHDEYGFSTEESQARIKIMDKRFRKLKLIEHELPEPKLYGPKDANLTIVGWGSVKGVILDALEELSIRDKQLGVNFLHITYIWPFPANRVGRILEKAKNVLLIENNRVGQLANLISQETGFRIKNKLLKYDGRPFFREEVIREIKKYIN
jgi:2-oxoglutarate ferredoxin oxidoreductase subunit alpha